MRRKQQARYRRMACAKRPRYYFSGASANPPKHGFVAFDPRRIAILLLGGDKTDHWQEWYDEYVPRADSLYV